MIIKLIIINVIINILFIYLCFIIIGEIFLLQVRFFVGFFINS